MRTALVATLFVASLIIAGVLGIGGWSCHQPQKPNSETAQIKKNAEKDCSTFYGTVIAGFRDSGAFVTANHDEINAASAVAIAIFTAVLSVFTISLSGSTRIAATATRGSIILAKDTAERQLRAYVFVKGGGIFLHNSQKIQAQVQLLNSGQTPGYDFKTWTGVRIGPPGENVFGDRKEWKQDSIIAPTGELNAPSDLLDITQEQIQAIVDKTQTIYVWGEASYRDAFNRIWTFEFRDTGSGPMRTLNPAEKLIGWGLSPQGYIETETKK
jgi:hypothetical protein